MFVRNGENQCWANFSGWAASVGHEMSNTTPFKPRPTEYNTRLMKTNKYLIIFFNLLADQRRPHGTP